LECEKTLDRFVEFLQGKKAKDINVIDIRGISVLADFFIICSGTSTTHIKAIADEVGQKATEMGSIQLHLEGYATARWILMDYGDIVVHVFHEEDRSFYNLERLWSDGILVTYN
jgi:ribosome-associated protein